jgi:hypothetical protein
VPSTGGFGGCPVVGATRYPVAFAQLSRDTAGSGAGSRDATGNGGAATRPGEIGRRNGGGSLSLRSLKSVVRAPIGCQSIGDTVNLF